MLNVATPLTALAVTVPDSVPPLLVFAAIASAMEVVDELTVVPTLSTTLTVIDGSNDFVLAKVTRKVLENRFQIRTSKPRVVVSWEVKGIRNDRWVQRNGAPVEVEKLGREKGKYQHPELYGAGAEMGMGYVEGARGAGRP